MALLQDPLFHNNGGVPLDVHIEYLGSTAVEAAYISQRAEHTTADWMNGHENHDLLRKLVLGLDPTEDIEAEI